MNPQQTYQPPPGRPDGGGQAQMQPPQRLQQSHSRHLSHGVPPRLPIASLSSTVNGKRAELKGHRGPKSKTGCLSCKARRIKCDELKPVCLQCKRKAVECVYGHLHDGAGSKTGSKASNGSSAARPPSMSGMSSTSSTSSVDAGRHAAARPPTSGSIVPSTAGSGVSLATTSTSTSMPAQMGVPPNTNTYEQQRAVEPSPSPVMRNLMRLNSGKQPLSLTPPLPIHIEQLLNNAAGSSASSVSDANLHSRVMATHSNSPSTASYDDELILLNTFFATATHLLSVYTGDCNPFMRLRKYVPHSRAVSLALQAMASFIASGYDIEDREECMNRGLELQQQAYQEINGLMMDSAARMDDTLFAAIIHIGMTEPWHPDRAGESGRHHLQASKRLIVERAKNGRQLPPRFLVNLLVYWDMLVALHSDTEVQDWDNALLAGRCTDEEPIDYIDPTLGLGQTLFPIIVELESFLRLVRNGRLMSPDAALTPEQDAIVMDLVQRLQNWRPSLDPARLQGCLGVFETCRLEDLIFTAEAYRQCALLLLYRTFPHALNPAEGFYRGEPRAHMLQSVASRVINVLRCIPGRSPTCCTHQWVLFVVSADVVSMPERHFIRERMDLLLEKVGIEGIRDVMRYIEDVWLAQDAGRADSSSWLDSMHARNWFPLLG